MQPWSCEPRFARQTAGGGCLYMVLLFLFHMVLLCVQILHFFFISRLFPEEEVGGQESGENYGDYAIHGEESSVEAGEIVGLYEGVFVEKKKDDGE